MLKFLYEITYKATIYRFCSGNKDINISGLLYKATYISHSRIVYTVDENLGACSIYTDIDNPISQLFMEFIPTSRVMVNIKRLKNGVVKPWKRGVIEEVLITNNYETEFKIGSLISVDRIANKNTYQSSCNHILYSEPCGVDINDYSLITNVTDVSEDGTEIIVSNLTMPGITDPTFFINGKIVIEATGASSKIVDVIFADNKIILLSFFRIQVGEEIRLSAGCNKSRNHCLIKFNNLNRASAEFYVPGRDPTKGI